jgi:2,4-dienoyl-CoA reductase-like NADH-dependent reductase (Old Yellow Enzyme family)
MVNMNRKNSIVFSPKRIGEMVIKNRLVRSATYENGATLKGEVTDFLVDLYSELAKGGAGMIITGITATYPKNIMPHKMMGVYDDSFLPGLKRISQAVHETDKDCKIILQLYHPGRQVTTQASGLNIAPYLSPALVAYIAKHPEIFEEKEGEVHEAEPTAPSSIFDTLLKQKPRALTLEEIESIIDCFANAIQRAQGAGFDGVQLHAAHGWLLNSFLSPRTNKREDQYGGLIENRIRIVKEIYERGRKKVDEDFPILIKLNTTDLLPDGITVEESVQMANIFSRLGFSAIEASGGMWEALARGEEELGWEPFMIPEARVDINTKEKEAYFLDGAKEIKKKIESPVILVGGIRSFSTAEEILAQEMADFVAMSRPLIRQPDLPNLWLSDTRQDKADCISCNACFPVGNMLLSCKAKKR